MLNLVSVKFNPSSKRQTGGSYILLVLTWFTPEGLSYAGGTVTGIGHVSKAAMTSSVVRT